MKTLTLFFAHMIVQSQNLSPLNDSLFQIKVDSTAKCYVKNVTVINAPAALVYETLTDVTKWPEWMQQVQSAKMEGKATVAKEFKWKAAGSNITSKFHTLIPSKAIGWTGKVMWISAVHNWTIEERNGKAYVEVSESMKGFGEGWLKKSIEKDMKKSLIELKERVELLQRNQMKSDK